MLTLETFDRMEGLVEIKAMKQLEKAIRSIAIDLVREGFDDTEVMQFIERIADFVVDDVLDPL
jgi:signal-transduction protein with cAMP-binding, CBS, and nucleotidyltransferase domain